MGRADLMADDPVHVVGFPTHLAQEVLPRLDAQGDAMLQDRGGIGVHRLRQRLGTV